MLGTEYRALRMLGKHSTTKLHSFNVLVKCKQLYQLEANSTILAKDAELD